MNDFDNNVNAGLAEFTTEFTPHDVELDITDFTVEEPDKQEIHLWININAEALYSFSRQMRPHIEALTPLQQDLYLMAIEFLKTTDHTANQAALAWLYDIAEANPDSAIEKKISTFMGLLK
jgi:diketogulonate reductase-like aldo/keto reductase